MSTNNDEHLNQGEQRLTAQPDEISTPIKNATIYRRTLDVCRAVKKSGLEVSAIDIEPDGRIKVCPFNNGDKLRTGPSNDDAERIAKAFLQ